MKMKYFILPFFFLTTYLSVAQNMEEKIVPDERLYAVYEKDYIDGLIKENPFLIKRWNFYLDHAFLIADAIPEKGNAYPTVTIADLNNINILLLEKEQNLQRDWDKPMIYNVMGMDKILVYHAGKDFTESLKKHLGEKP